MARQRLVPLRLSDAIAAYQLAAAEQLTDAERRDIAARRVAALTPEQRAELAADRNRQLLSSTELRVRATAIKVDGPRATVPRPAARRSQPITEAEMERRGW